ncbi:GTPase RsgA, partial [Candidatus Margulisiibacteriota bacterium]
MTKLSSFGWNPWFEEAFNKNEVKDSIPAKIVGEYQDQYKVHTGTQALKAVVTGKLLHYSDESDFPKIGDWVVLTIADKDLGVIHETLPRKTHLSRKRPGTNIKEQLIAANVDVVFIVMGLDHDFNLRRLERYITAVNKTGARPVAVLNKTDICRSTKEKLASIKKLYKNMP